MRLATSRSSKWPNGWRNREAQRLEVSVWPRVVGFWTAPSIVQVNGVLLHGLSSIGFSSQSGRRQSWWQGFICYFRCGELIGTYITVDHIHILPPQILSTHLTLWNIRSRETSSKTLREPVAPAWRLMTHRNVFSKRRIPESRDLDLRKNVVCGPIFFLLLDEGLN
jgi:hypothetical protein